MNRLRLLPDPDLELAVVDLRLFARLGLEPHRRQLRPLPLRAVRLKQALHLLIAPGKPKAHQLPVQNRTVPPDLRRALLDELGEAIERPG